MARRIVSMTEVNEDAVPVWKAAELLHLTIADVYDLVFSRRLASIESATGRRLVPRAAIDDFRAQQRPAPA
jgi:hypothetical protein